MPQARHRAEEPELLRGTLTTFRRRCGKSSCHCASGEPHESPALTYWVEGRTKTLTLGAGDVAVVRAALKRYDRAKAVLDADADKGLTVLRKRRGAEHGAPRR